VIQWSYKPYCLSGSIACSKKYVQTGCFNGYVLDGYIQCGYVSGTTCVSGYALEGYVQCGYVTEGNIGEYVTTGYVTGGYI